ncbi:MAG: SDR family NAD(P)-dependent oxidoreductase [Myxococcales bacterium]|nr:SDR family NAD(P)-dependent oxidoreductase [Myxococcales bacterium]
MTRPLEQCTAIVTGATRGVGRGVAVELAAQGAVVYVTGRTLREGDSRWPGSLESTIAEAEALGGRIVGLVCDHRDDEQVRAVFDRVRAEQDRLDLLVNNAFLIPDDMDPNAPFWETGLDCWDDMHTIGARSAYVGTWHAAPIMIAQGRGLIANVSSQGARYYTLHPAYGAAKAALDRLTRDCGHELAPHGVATVSVWPSFVTTERMLALDAEAWQLDLDGAESPRFTGRGIAALLLDPDLMQKTGRVFTTRWLAETYGFRDVDGRLPDGAPDPGDPGPLLLPD